MPSIVVRQAQSGDLPALSALAARTFEATYGADNDADNVALHIKTAFGSEQQRAELASPDWMTLLMCDEQVLLGYAQLRRKSTPASASAHADVELHRFYLDTPAQGRGLGPRLMAHVKAGARELGAHRLWLGVWERNSRAIAFYRRCGFCHDGNIGFMFGSEPQNDLVMITGLDVEKERAVDCET